MDFKLRRHPILARPGKLAGIHGNCGVVCGGGGRFHQECLKFVGLMSFLQLQLGEEFLHLFYDTPVPFAPALFKPTCRQAAQDLGLLLGKIAPQAGLSVRL